jgi:hypothetical protein
MEHIVSILQRLWSQLEIDTSMLLDEMGDICSDNNNKTTASNNNIMSLPLMKFQNAGNNYREIDPTKIDIPDLNIDIWSSTDIVINECKEAKDKIISIYNDQSKNIEFTTKLNDKFLTHATFIQSLIERLCFAINITGMFEQVPDVLEVLSLAKELNAERFSLTIPVDAGGPTRRVKELILFFIAAGKTLHILFKASIAPLDKGASPNCETH